MRENLKSKKGITLIALVITIIVLLILAGVTIATLTGDNGIINKATEARERTKQANAEEQVKLAVTASIGENGKIQNGDLKTNLDTIENIKEVPTTITDSSYPLTVIVDGYDVTIKKDGSVFLGKWKPGNPDEETGIYTESSTINGASANKNNPIIPAGFKPVNEGEANWGDGTTDPLGVNKGLVIEDEEKNQYVWIPVDGILGENGKTVQNAVDGEIILGRYSFNYSDGTIVTSRTPTSLGGALTDPANDIYTETSSGNIGAKDIGKFINSVKINGGYYMARFEASQGLNDEVESKYDKPVWNSITQLAAAEACQGLYAGINSDLMNSYAWDTAILFIQKNQSEGETPYSIQKRLQKTLANTGKATDGTNYDVKCNIYDMAGNCWEWTTETSSRFPCVNRGGGYIDNNNNRSVGFRGSSNINDGYLYNSFRSILYL